MLDNAKKFSRESELVGKPSQQNSARPVEKKKHFQNLSPSLIRMYCLLQRCTWYWKNITNIISC